YGQRRSDIAYLGLRPLRRAGCAADRSRTRAPRRPVASTRSTPARPQKVAHPYGDAVPVFVLICLERDDRERADTASHPVVSPCVTEGGGHIRADAACSVCLLAAAAAAWSTGRTAASSGMLVPRRTLAADNPDSGFVAKHMLDGSLAPFLRQRGSRCAWRR